MAAWGFVCTAVILSACSDNDTQLNDFFLTAELQPLTVTGTFGQLDGDMATGSLQHFVTLQLDPHNLAIRTPSTGIAKFVRVIDGIPNCIVLKPKARSRGTSTEGLDNSLPHFKDLRVVLGNLDNGTPLRDDIIDLERNSRGLSAADAPAKADEFLTVGLTTKEEDWPYLDVYADPEVSNASKPRSSFGVAAGGQLKVTAYRWHDLNLNDVDEDGERTFVNPLPYLSKIPGLEGRIRRQPPVVDMFIVQDSTSPTDFSAATPFPMDTMTTDSAGVVKDFIRFQFSLEEFDTTNPSGPSVIPYEISYELEHVERNGATITPLATVSRSTLHCNSLSPSGSAAVRDTLYAAQTDTGSNDFWFNLPVNTAIPVPTNPPAENALAHGLDFVLNVDRVFAGRVFPSGDYRITLTLRDALNPDPPAAQVAGHFKIEGPEIEITEILGLRSANFGDFSQQADPHAPGRIFIDTTETWGGGAMVPADYNNQRVRISVEIRLPNTLDLADFVLNWVARDPDDPAGHKDVDPMDPHDKGGDNTGTPHENKTHWFTEANHSISNQVSQPAVDELSAIGLAQTEITNVGGTLTSTVFFNFSDDGGDNYVIEASIDEGIDNRDSDRSGVLTVWRKRFVTVNSMTKQNDDVQAHAVGTSPGAGVVIVEDGANDVSDTIVLGGDDLREGENVTAGDDGIANTTRNSGGASYDPGVNHPVQDTLREAYANANPDRNCYIDIVVNAGINSMAFAAVAPGTVYLSNEIHASGTMNAHADMHYYLDGLGFLVPTLKGTAVVAPHAVLFLRDILQTQTPGQDDVSYNAVHELGHCIASRQSAGATVPNADGFEALHTSHSEAPDDACAGRPGIGHGVHWCPRHARVFRNNATRTWANHTLVTGDTFETSRDSD